ncbi:MAG: tRNA threonylcarbamoyladenosine biosynthesis protein TsaE [Halioglobus sp.]|jgi:tRNA threonylcarbamoyladenosine biosynthesis protein TsaE
MSQAEKEQAAYLLEAVDEDVMISLGGQLSAVRVPGMVVYLNGELGMGKTTFSRGFIRALGHTGAVKSPTYTLVEPYEFNGLIVYHFDLYRLNDPEELEFMGIRDYFDGSNIALIEWPEKGLGILPPADLVINIEQRGSGRSLIYIGASDIGKKVVDQLKNVGVKCV